MTFNRLKFVWTPPKNIPRVMFFFFVFVSFLVSTSGLCGWFCKVDFQGLATVPGAKLELGNQHHVEVCVLLLVTTSLTKHTRLQCLLISWYKNRSALQVHAAVSLTRQTFSLSHSRSQQESKKNKKLSPSSNNNISLCLSLYALPTNK